MWSDFLGSQRSASHVDASATAVAKHFVAEFQAIAQETATKFLQSDWAAQAVSVKKHPQAEPKNHYPKGTNSYPTFECEIILSLPSKMRSLRI